MGNWTGLKLIDTGQMVNRRTFLGCVGAAPLRALEAGWKDRVAETLPRLMQEFSVPGVGIAVIEDARVAWRRGFGVKDVESKAPVDETTMFEAASMSKPVFAYAVMRLVERGVIGLDTPIARYAQAPVPLGSDDPRFKAITPRHVLTHRTGLPNWRSASVVKPAFDPGERWQYSGEGFWYLQTVISQLTGQTDKASCGKFEGGVEVCATDSDAWMKRNVLGPLGMKSSTYVWNAALCDKRMARPHDAKGQALANGKSKATDVARYGSAGALLTTPSDYARFLIEVMKGGSARLGKASVAEMLRPQVKVETVAGGIEIWWALGWKAAKLPSGGVVISHGGDNRGFHCVAAMSPVKRTGFVVMTNGDGGPQLLGRIAPLMDERVS